MLSVCGNQISLLQKYTAHDSFFSTFSLYSIRYNSGEIANVRERFPDNSLIHRIPALSYQITFGLFFLIHHLGKKHLMCTVK